MIVERCSQFLKPTGYSSDHFRWRMRRKLGLRFLGKEKMRDRHGDMVDIGVFESKLVKPIHEYT